jgi:hypothetical protein
LYGAFVWARRALNRPKRRFRVRADGEQAGLLGLVELPTRALSDVDAAGAGGAAGLDEGFLSLSLNILIYLENPYRDNK